MSDEYDTCDRCGRDVYPDDLQTITVVEKHEVCPGCMNDVSEDIDNYDWQDRYTEEQHERAVSLLAERDEILCVISSYEDAQIIVHTPYVTSDVVLDFCNHFGFYITHFAPCWKQESEYPCINDHGSVFQITLSYTHRSRPPIPMNVEFKPSRIDDLSESDQQFDRKI